MSKIICIFLLVVIVSACIYCVGHNTTDLTNFRVPNLRQRIALIADLEPPDFTYIDDGSWLEKFFDGITTTVGGVFESLVYAVDVVGIFVFGRGVTA